MGKSRRHVELPPVFPREQRRVMLSVGGTSRSQIDSDIQHTSTNHTDQFALGVRRCLEVQAPQHAGFGHTFVGLDKPHRLARGLVEHLLVPSF